jgi:hypothetical protein
VTHCAARRGRRLFPRLERKLRSVKAASGTARSQGWGQVKAEGIDGSDRTATGGGAGSPLIVLPVCQSTTPPGSSTPLPPRPSIHLIPSCTVSMYSKHLAGGPPRRPHHARRRRCVPSRRCHAGSLPPPLVHVPEARRARSTNGDGGRRAQALWIGAPDDARWAWLLASPP